MPEKHAAVPDWEWSQRLGLEPGSELGVGRRRHRLTLRDGRSKPHEEGTTVVGIGHAGGSSGRSAGSKSAK